MVDIQIIKFNINVCSAYCVKSPTSLSLTPNSHHSPKVHQRPKLDPSSLQGWVGAQIQPGCDQCLVASAQGRSFLTTVCCKGAQFYNLYKDTVCASHSAGCRYAFDCKTKIQLKAALASWDEKPMFAENPSGLS